MLPRTTGPVPLGPTSALYTRPEPGQGAARRKAVQTTARQVVRPRDQRLVAAAGTTHRTSGADRPAPSRAGIGSDALRTAGSGTVPAPCPLRSASQIVCADQGSCTCPLSGQVTDVERAVMNDISRQASRLRAVFFWIFVLVALAAALALLLR